MRRLPFAAGAAALAAVPLLALLPVGPAVAADRTVSIGSTAFTPSTATLAPGDTIAFTNSTGTLVTLSYSANWPGSPGSQALAPGQTSTRRTLNAAGTYTASASGFQVDSSGRVVVKAPVTSRSPTPRPSGTSARPKPTAPGPSRSTPPPSSSPTATTSSPAPSAAASATPSTDQPGPTIPTPGVPTGRPTDDPPVVADGDKRALFQPHAVRRLGLPGAVGAVLLLGLLAAIVRVLLAHPAARRTT